MGKFNSTTLLPYQKPKDNRLANMKYIFENRKFTNLSKYKNSVDQKERSIIMKRNADHDQSYFNEDIDFV
jgi:hypothetical protein